jgi:ribonuclease P protein component
MKKRDIVKSNILFNEIIDKGYRISNKYYVICRMKKEEESNKYGIAVGKKIGNAVVRNKIKRQIKNIIDQNYNMFPNNHNYIIICKKEILDLTYQDMTNELVKLINKGDNNEK